MRLGSARFGLVRHGEVGEGAPAPSFIAWRRRPHDGDGVQRIRAVVVLSSFANLNLELAEAMSDVVEMREDVPLGYWEALLALVKSAPRLPERDEGAFPDPIV